MDLDITDADRAALRNNLAIYLGKKPLEDELKERSKTVHDERVAAQKQVLQIMSEKKIPICKSSEFPFQVSLINKKRKTAPKATDYLDTVEQRYGAPARNEVEQETKRRCTEVKEAPTLKLTKVEGADMPAIAPAQSAPATPVVAPPRYDENNDEDSE